jgi:hypothetical protein
MRWKAVRPVSYCASLTAGLDAGCGEVSAPVFFSSVEHEAIKNKAKDKHAILKTSLNKAGLALELIEVIRINDEVFGAAMQ